MRVNGLDTPWIARDIAAMVAAKPDAILIPKISRTEDIRRARAALAAAQAPRDAEPVGDDRDAARPCSTPSAIAAIARHAGAPLDLLRDRHQRPAARDRRHASSPAARRCCRRSPRCVLAAAPTASPCSTAPSTTSTTATGFRAECEQGRDLGMDGKTLIHPTPGADRQRGLRAVAEEVAWAREGDRRLRRAGERQQGRHHRSRADGRAPARAHGAPGDRDGDGDPA